MPYIDKRTYALEVYEIEEFILDHIPYRIKVLKNVISYPIKMNTDDLWPSIYESAQIVCRMFIQFFGLRTDPKDRTKLKHSHNYYSVDGKTSFEVKVIDLKFEFVRVEELTIEEQNVLAHAYEAGSKATAHLTYKSSFQTDHAKVIEAAVLILRMIESRLI